MIGLVLRRLINGGNFASASEGLIFRKGFYLGKLILLMNFGSAKGTPMIKNYNFRSGSSLFYGEKYKKELSSGTLKNESNNVQ